MLCGAATARESDVKRKGKNPREGDKGNHQKKKRYRTEKVTGKKISPPKLGSDH